MQFSCMSPLRKWRGRRTLEDCAQVLGTTVSTLSRLERGKQWVSRELAEQIATKTGLTLDQLAWKAPAEHAA
jgi:transcriptional regulator with XRE-family HTH domain